jgi:hypothetical protein
MEELMRALSTLSIGNKGEQDEFAFKKDMFKNRRNITYCVDLFGEKGRGGIDLINPKNGRPYETITEIQRKASSMSKSDAMVLLKIPNELLYLSIKSKRGQKPSLLNHTPRSANIFQNGPLKEELVHLDMIAKEYHDKRIAGILTEDVKMATLDTYAIFPIKQSILKMLIYFIFRGTGSRHATQECNSIIIMNKDGPNTYIPCITEEEKENYVLGLMDHCVLSFRNKGMRKKISEQDIPWVGNYHGKEYGAIHIRLSLK